MFLVNTSTKKFVDSASLDLGLLPADGKIDIQLTDGSEPVVAEGKTFTMTIGTIEPTLYKTDDDTVSFRYIHFDDENVATTMAISLYMDGVEVLDDTISLTYTEAGGGDPFPQGGQTGDYLQKTATGQTWAEVPAELPSATSSDSGKVLTVDSSGSPEWADVPAELPSATSSDSGKVLTVDSSGSPEWADAQGGGGVLDANDYLCFTAAQANSTVRLDKVGSPDAINLEYSTDKTTWTDYTWSGTTGTTITLANIGDKVWFRGDNSAFGGYKFVMSGSVKGSGTLASIVDKKCGFIPISCSFAGLFKGNTSILTAPELPRFQKDFVPYEAFKEMYSGCTSLFAPPADIIGNCDGEDSCRKMFYHCTSLLRTPKISGGFGRSSLSEMFSGCTKLCEATLCIQHASSYSFENCFSGCTNLKEATIYIINSLYVANTNVFHNTFSGCSSLTLVKCFGWANWGEYFSGWLNNVASGGTIITDAKVLQTTQIPADWTVVSTTSLLETSFKRNQATSSATVEIKPKNDVVQIQVSSALTLNASSVSSSNIAYAEIVLDIDANATVTAGTNLTLVDTLTAGKRNVCVVRWSGGVAKLYVTITEDLESSSASA